MVPILSCVFITTLKLTILFVNCSLQYECLLYFSFAFHHETNDDGVFSYLFNNKQWLRYFSYVFITKPMLAVLFLQFSITRLMVAVLFPYFHNETDGYFTFPSSLIAKLMITISKGLRPTPPPRVVFLMRIRSAYIFVALAACFSVTLFDFC